MGMVWRQALVPAEEVIREAILQAEVGAEVLKDQASPLEAAVVEALARAVELNL